MFVYKHKKISDNVLFFLLEFNMRKYAQLTKTACKFVITLYKIISVLKTRA